MSKNYGIGPAAGGDLSSGEYVAARFIVGKRVRMGQIAFEDAVLRLKRWDNREVLVRGSSITDFTQDSFVGPQWLNTALNGRRGGFRRCTLSTMAGEIYYIELSPKNADYLAEAIFTTSST